MEKRISKKWKIAISWWTKKHCGSWKAWLFRYIRYDLISPHRGFEITLLGFRAGAFSKCTF